MPKKGKGVGGRSEGGRSRREQPDAKLRLSATENRQLSSFVRDVLEKDGQETTGPISEFLKAVFTQLIFAQKNNNIQLTHVAADMLFVEDTEAKVVAIAAFQALQSLHYTDMESWPRLVTQLNDSGVLASFFNIVRDKLMFRIDTEPWVGPETLVFETEMGKGFPYEEVIMLDSHKYARMMIETEETSGVTGVLFEGAEQDPTTALDIYESICAVFDVRINDIEDGQAKKDARRTKDNFIREMQEHASDVLKKDVTNRHGVRMSGEAGLSFFAQGVLQAPRRLQ